MRKAIAWLLLIALVVVQCVAFAEGGVQTVASVAVNGLDAVRTASDVYLAVPSGNQEMLVRVPLNGGDAICVDRADDFDGLLPYSGGLAYLKTTGGSSAIMQCIGNDVSTVYSFGATAASSLSYFSGKMLVLIDGLLHSVEPSTQLCLKLSGAEMLDYVLGDGFAYFLSGGDRMEYTAQLEEGEISKQAGCVYRLDLNSGETTLLLKSGGEDLKIFEHNLYFHNLADAYAVRTDAGANLLGRVYSLDVQLKTLNQECAEPDNGFWPMDKGLAALYNGAINLDTEAGVLALYTPENGASVVSDGNYIYVWEPGKLSLTELQSNGTAAVIHSGDLAQAMDAAMITPEPTVTPSPTPEAVSDEDEGGNAAWFDQFMANKELASGGSSSGSSSVKVSATPIGATPTPVPVTTFVPTLGSVGNTNTNTGASTSAGSSSSGGSSSSSNQSSGSTYSVNISYLEVTGGSVNIRSKAGMNGSIIASASKGMVLKCAGVASKDSSGMTWYKVTYNGNSGWISSKYAKKTSYSSSSSSSDQSGPEVSMSGDEVRIVNGNVTLRAKPNKNSSRLCSISKGERVDFLNKASTDSRGVVWFKVSYNGKTGWVSSKYAQITNSSGSGSGSSSGGSSPSSGDEVKIVNGNVTIRSQPNKNSSKLGYISKGKKATYLGDAQKDSRGIWWYRVNYKGTVGWVSSMYSKIV